MKSSSEPRHIITYECIQHNPDHALEKIGQSTQLRSVMVRLW